MTWAVKETRTQISVRDENERIAVIAITPLSPRANEGRRYAAVIAAAPKMLAALKLAEDQICDDNPDKSHALVEVRRAIAEADGTS